MAWTTPKTFTSLSVLTAADLNTHLRDNTQHLYDTRPLLTRGLSTGATDAGGNIVIAHGLGVVPAAVVTTLDALSNTGLTRQVAVLNVGGIDATNFSVEVVRSDTGAKLASQVVGFYWVAVD